MNKTSSNDQVIAPNKKSLGMYLFFLGGQMVSLLGSTIVTFCIIWWITLETNSTFYLGLASFMGFFPQLILTPLAGVYIDRWNRKIVLILADLLQAILILPLIYMFYTDLGSIWWVLIIMGFRGVFAAFHFPATQAIIPLLVPRSFLSRINGTQFIINGFIFATGTLIAAVLLIFLRIDQIIWIDIITVVIALIPLLLIKIPAVSLLKNRLKKEKSFFGELNEGIKYIRRKDGLISLLLIFSAANLFITPINRLLPVLILDFHFGNAQILAFLFVVIQVGGTTGGILMSIWKGFTKKVYGVICGLTLMNLGVLIIITASSGLWLQISIGLFLVGFGLPIANASSTTIWQTITPPELMGRVFSARRTIAQITAPFGILIAGAIAELLGMIPTFIIFGMLNIVVILFLWFKTNLSQVESS
ncbi:MAG: MFS transporter [Candidatus Hermodarchaeota archaeon]